MIKIKEILNTDNPSIEDLINCFEQVRKNGDIAVIKFDGEREVNQYTVFISFPIGKSREMIRADQSTLKGALINVLTVYVSENQ